MPRSLFVQGQRSRACLLLCLRGVRHSERRDTSPHRQPNTVRKHHCANRNRKWLQDGDPALTAWDWRSCSVLLSCSAKRCTFRATQICLAGWSGCQGSLRSAKVARSPFALHFPAPSALLVFLNKHGLAALLHTNKDRNGSPAGTLQVPRENTGGPREVLSAAATRRSLQQPEEQSAGSLSGDHWPELLSMGSRRTAICSPSSWPPRPQLEPSATGSGTADPPAPWCLMLSGVSEVHFYTACWAGTREPRSQSYSLASPWTEKRCVLTAPQISLHLPNSQGR